MRKSYRKPLSYNLNGKKNTEERLNRELNTAWLSNNAPRNSTY